MDSKAIETLSVSAVTSALGRYNFCDPQIPIGDRTPSWDGDIYLYNHQGKSKNNLIGRIHTQVKGKEFPNEFPKRIRYPIMLSDLKNYRNDGGAIFFVVYLNANCTPKIYYKALLPVAIIKLLHDTKNKTQISVSFTEFPSDDSELVEAILLNHLQNSRKQSSFAQAQLFTLEQLIAENKQLKIILPVSGVGNLDLDDILFNIDPCLYVDVEGSCILQPILTPPINFISENNVFGDVLVNGRCFYTNYTTLRTKDKTTFKFGNFVSLTLFNEDRRCKLEFKKSNSLRGLANDIDFYLSFINYGSLRIGQNDLIFDKNSLDFSEVPVEKYEEKLKFCQKIIQIFDILHCSSDLDISKLSEQDIRHLNYLYTAFVEQKPVRGLPADLNILMKLTVAQLEFALVFQKDLTDSDLYNIYDYFNHYLKVIYKSDNGLEYETSQYRVFTGQDLINISNIDFDVLLASFQGLETDYKYCEANEFLLQLIHAFDLSDEKRKDIINTIKVFDAWLLENSPNDIINKINHYQIIRRQRSLTATEQEDLVDILQNDDTPEQGKVCALILLEKFEQAQSVFEKMSKLLQDDFLRYPINYLWIR